MPMCTRRRNRGAGPGKSEREGLWRSRKLLKKVLELRLSGLSSFQASVSSCCTQSPTRPQGLLIVALTLLVMMVGRALGGRAVLQGAPRALRRRKRPPTPILLASGPGQASKLTLTSWESEANPQQQNTWRKHSPSLEFWQTYYPNQYLGDYSPF